MFLSRVRTWRLGLVAAAAISVVWAAGSRDAHGQAAQDAPKPAFDAASIHEWGANQGPSGRYSAGLQLSAGRVRAQCANLQGLISNAYHLTGSDPVEGIPQWGQASCGFPDSRNTFAIEATMPVGTTPAQERLMLQNLLAERFKLAVHWETRQLPVYALRVIPGKSKLKPSDPAKDPPTGPLGCPADDHYCKNASFGSATLGEVAGLFSLILKRPVIDRTGMAGTYYFGTLIWAGEETNDSPLPSLSSLLREDFGLQLKSESGPVRVLIVDHVEKPTAN